MMWDTLFRVAASPLLIAQALRVRRIAQSLPEATGPRSGVTGNGPALRLAIIGDSSAAGVGVATQDQALAGQTVAALSQDFTVHWHLDALTGATTKSTLTRLRATPPRPADVAIIALGVNDVTRLVPAQTWVDQQEALLQLVKATYGVTQFYLSAMPPLHAFPLLPEPLRWTLGRHAHKLEAARLAHLATRTDCTHVPFDLPNDPNLMASDGFHPSEALYALWGAEMAQRIKAAWPDSTPPKS